VTHVRCAANYFVSAALALLLSAPCPAQAPAPAAPPPVEAFGRLPVLAQPSLSPDGKHLATIKPYNGRSVAVIYDLSDPTAKPVILPLDEGFIVGVQWANNDRLLVTINLNKGMLGYDMIAWYRTVSADTKGKNFTVLFKNNKDIDYNPSASNILDLDLDDPDHIFMTLYKDESDLTSAFSKPQMIVFKVNVNSGNASYFTKGGLRTVDYIMDGHGKLAARIDRLENPLRDEVLANDNDDWKKIAEYNSEGGHGSGVVGLSQDGQALVQTAINPDTGTTGLIILPLSGKNESKTLFLDPKYDIDGALQDPWTNRVIGAAVTDDMSQDRYFDPAMQALQKGLEANFPGNSVHAVNWDMAMDRVIFAVDGPRMPRTYFYLDRATHKAMFLAATYPNLHEEDLGETKPYPYKARDGLDIPAYLTLPPGKAPKNLPAVILPHGGPAARDAMGFDWEAQFLANRGYAVLQPNFRGSTGYGQKFEEAGYGQWGLKMQDDVTDGAKKLIADGIADPRRICIVGGSYGGYAALAGAAFTPDLYACAVSWAGISDLKELWSAERSNSGHNEWLMSAIERFIGDRWKDGDRLEAVSPALHAANVKVPVLLMHGTADTRVHIDQSEIMERALKKAGKKVAFISIKGEVHTMEAAETRIRFLTELEKFLAANIGN
jgi:dipeptidyl aminopeptidase/acylaminoacyl peptidase